MDDVKTLKVKKILSVLWRLMIVAIFSLLLICIAQYHEPWGDEAQSFLLARDTSFKEVFKYIRYEVTPPLWIFIIKLFILLGGTYDYYYILPILFSIIGICIFEFKVKAPWYIKILLPFTYYIAYQYSIIARSYCLILPMLMIFACLDNKKMEKPILYAIMLFPLMTISLHTLCIAGSFFLIFIIDIIKNKKIKTKKYIVACIIIFLELLLTTIITYPTSDCYYIGEGRNIGYIIAEATFSSDSKFYLLIFAVVSLSFATIIFDNKDKGKILEFLILFVPILSLLVFVACQPWHIGIIFLLLIYYLLISNLLNENTFAKIIFTCMCLVQIIWTINTYKYDIHNDYSASKDVANFIKAKNFEDKKIYGLQFSITAIQPYFEHNIFANQRPVDKAFWSWSKKDSCIFESNKEIIDADADIYIVSTFGNLRYENVMKRLEELNYKKGSIEGYSFFKTYRYEPQGYIIYIKPELLN